MVLLPIAHDASLAKARSAEDELVTHPLRFICLLLFQVKALAETLHPASAVENALLPREERMALRAHIHAHILPDAPCLKRISTSARHSGFHKIRVNPSFHRSFSQSFRRMSLWPENGRALCQGQRQRPREVIASVALYTSPPQPSSDDEDNFSRTDFSIPRGANSEAGEAMSLPQQEPFEISAFFLRPRLEASTLATETHPPIISHAAKAGRLSEQPRARLSFASVPLSRLYCAQRGSGKHTPA